MPPPSGLPPPLRRLSPVPPTFLRRDMCATAPAGPVALVGLARAALPAAPLRPFMDGVRSSRASRLRPAQAPFSAVKPVFTARRVHGWLRRRWSPVPGIPEPATITALRELRTGMNRREPERL